MTSKCYLHGRRDAQISCDRCERAICETCIQIEGMSTVCPACLGGGATAVKRGARSLVMWGVLAAGVGVLGYGLYTATLSATHGIDDMSIAELEQRARVDDKNAALFRRLGDLYREESKLAHARSAYERGARAEPDDPRLQYRLGMVYYDVGDLHRAETHLLRARAMGSKEPDLQAALAKLEVRREEATRNAQRLAEEQAATNRARAEARAAQAKERALLAQARRDEAHSARAEAYARANEARAEAIVQAEAGRAEAWAEAKEREIEAQEAADDRAAQDCYISLGRGHGLRLAAEVDGVEAEFVFDTGATITAFTAEFAERIDAQIIPDRMITVNTANGQTQAQLATVGWMMVAGVEHENLTVAVCRDCPGFHDGLFGLDLQKRFDMRLDLKNRRVRVPGCQI